MGLVLNMPLMRLFRVIERDRVFSMGNNVKMMLEDVRQCLLLDHMIYSDVQLLKTYVAIADTSNYYGQYRPTAVFSKKEWAYVFATLLSRFANNEVILLEIFHLAYCFEDVLMYTAHTYLFKIKMSPFTMERLIDMYDRNKKIDPVTTKMCLEIITQKFVYGTIELRTTKI